MQHGTYIILSYMCCTTFILYILAPLFLPSSVSLPYFILAVPMRECLGKHSSMLHISYGYTELYLLLSDTATVQCVQSVHA